MKLRLSWLLWSCSLVPSSLVACGESAGETLNVCALDGTCQSESAGERGTLVSARAEGAPVTLVALDAGPHCSHEPSGELVCALGPNDSVTLLAPELAGHRFVRWEGAPVCSSDARELLLHGVHEPARCVARYVQRLRVEGVIGGVAQDQAGPQVIAQTGSPYARCEGGRCEVDRGQPVVLIAPERPGLRFVGFDGADCKRTGDTTALVTASAGDVRCVAEYVQGFVVEGTARGLRGTTTGVTASSDAPSARCQAGSCVIAPGASVVLQAPEVPGFRFRGWSGDGPCTGSDPTLRLANVDGSLHCMAEYVLRFPVSGRADGAPAQIVIASDPTAHCREGVCEVDQGASATVTASSVPGFRLRGFSGAGCVAAGGDLATVDDVQGPVECVAHYVQGVAVSGTLNNAGGTPSNPSLSVVATSTSAGATCEAGRCAIDVGGSVTLTAPTLPGRTFLGWSGDPGCTGTTPALVLPMVTTSISCSAGFLPLRRVEGLVVPSAAGAVVASASVPSARCQAGACDFEGSADVVLQVTGNAGFRFAGWSGAPGCTGANAQLKLASLSADTRCTANFILRVPVTTDVTPAGSGSVVASSLSAAQACKDGACTVDAGSEVLLVPVASAGHRFVQWRGCSTSTTNLLILPGLTAAAQCTAVFERITHQVTGTPNGNGSVSLRMGNTVCPATGCIVPDGASVTLTAQPAAGHVFSGWKGCAASKSLTITLPMVMGDRGCIANFVKG